MACALPQATIANFQDSFFASEANINGIWNGLLSDAFYGTFPAGASGHTFTICQEEYLAIGTSALRVDLMIYETTGAGQFGVVI